MRKMLPFSVIATTILGFGLSTSLAYSQSDVTKKVEVTGPGPDSVLINSVTTREAQTAVVHPTPDGSAPALSNIWVNNVCTDQAGTNCETISTNQGATVNTYHAAAAYVFVWEIGYGVGETATQGGTQIASAYMVGKVPVCVSGGYYTTTCANGSTVYGYRYEWNAGYYLNLGYGTHFAAQDTSINSPYNTVNTFINILYSH